MHVKGGKKQEEEEEEEEVGLVYMLNIIELHVTCLHIIYIF